MSLLLWNALLDAVKGRNGNEIVKMQFSGNEQRCIDLMGGGGIKVSSCATFQVYLFSVKGKTSIYLNRQWIPNYTR